jgi:hypothetical protein
MKKLILTIFIFCMFARMGNAATNVTFGWDATPVDCNTVKLYQSAVSGVYTYNAANVKATALRPAVTATIANVPDGAWYWVATCTDTANNESGPSNQVTATFDSTAPNAPTGFKINLTVNVTVSP